MNDDWKERKNPARIERRFIFDDYETLRVFLENAAALSEEKDFYPDIGFGREYANVVIYAADDADEVAPEQIQFAEKLDQFYTANTVN